MVGLEDMVKKYVITTAQYGAPLHRPFYDSLSTYARVNNAEIIVLPTDGMYRDDDKLADELQLHTVISRDMPLNDNLKISSYGVKPQQINPLTGIKRFAQGEKSFIFASPKQVVEYVANSYDAIPKAVMTTGAITKPYYKTHTRMGAIAEKDHEIGAVVVEVENNKIFHFRHIKAKQNGTFYDINGVYEGSKHKKYPGALGFVVADLHPYDTDPKHEKLTFEQLEYFKPKHVFLHDTFNGKSISHHYDGHLFEQHRVYNEQGLDLGKELRDTAQAIKRYAEAVKGTVHIVASNHDEHLHRYLDEGRFIGDKGNMLVGAQLYVKTLMGANPLEAGLDMYGGVPKNVHFISRDEGYKLQGVECGNHGDLGANGAKPSLRSIEEANGKSITAHGHSAFKHRDTYRVGTSTHLRLSYNRGYSNWTQTNAVMHPDGSVQLLNSIKQSWRSE